MVSQITKGVTISVETFYQPEFSNPANNDWMFAYEIHITNDNAFPVQLISRHWHIFDSDASFREVEGEGVVGQQPILQPGASYNYSSGCNLRSEIGKMHGTYLFENLHDKTTFTVNIPLFEMYAPTKLN